MIHSSCRYQRGRGVQQNHIAACRFLTTQYFANDSCVFGGISARNIFERSSLHPELFGINFERPHGSVASLGYTGWTGDGDLVESIEAVHHERAAQSQHAERLSELLDHIESIDADDLS